jgi:hypothetical protein
LEYSEKIIDKDNAIEKLNVNFNELKRHVDLVYNDFKVFTEFSKVYPELAKPVLDSMLSSEVINNIFTNMHFSPFG